MKINNFGLLAFMLVIIMSCEDVFVKDISDEMIELQGPADGVEASAQKFSFWWSELDGALKYQLQIVSPDKLSPLTIPLDTVITKSRFDFELPAGNYEWCVRGINLEYKTEYACHKIIVH